MSIRGINGGAVTFTHGEANGRYSVSATAKPSGLVKRIRAFSYQAASSGRITSSGLAPSRYDENADTVRRQSKAVLTYRGGVPKVERYVSNNDPAPNTPAASTQGGTLDPLTGIYSVLRDRPIAQGCATRLVMFDGRRRSHIILQPAQSTGDTIRCTGEYRRLQGFTEQELSRHVAIPFEVILEPLDADTLRVRRVAFKSVYGVAALTRR